MMAFIVLMVGFFRTLLVLVVIFYAVRLVTRYVLPIFIQKSVRNMQEKMQQQMRDQQRGNRREGEVTIEKPQGNAPARNTQGEYVDFEEVE